MIDGYSIGKQIGKGTYGQVFAGTNPFELSVLKSIAHANVLALLDVVIKGNCESVFLVTPLYECDLRSYVKKNFAESSFRVDERILKPIFHQLVNAVDYLHDMHVLHRDIKPQNVLVKFEGPNSLGLNNILVVLSDFGLAKFVVKQTLPKARKSSSSCTPMTHEIVTLWYRAPEVLLGWTEYGTGVDIWSLGVVLLELSVGRCPFNGHSEIETLMRIFRLCGTPDRSNKLYAKMPLFSEKFPQWPIHGFTKRMDGLIREHVGDDRIVLSACDMLHVDPGNRVDARQLAMDWNKICTE